MVTIPQHGVDFREISRKRQYLKLKAKVGYAERRFMSTDMLWPGITSPVARRVVRTAYRMLPADTFYGPAFDEPGKCPMEIHDYQLWLDDTLLRSGLAKGLAGGEALLPDPTTHLPWPWQYLARRFGPRNIDQLTRLVGRNLEWYVDQSRKLQDPWTVAADQLPMTSLLTVLLLGALATATPLYQLHWVILTGLALLTVVLVFTAQVYWGRDTFRHKTNCAELYHYLVREYTDVAEDPEADPEQYRLKLRGKITA